MNTEQQLHAIVHGLVQGVSFRYYTVQEAHRLGVTGWVRNRLDRTVEVRAEGTREQLEKLLAFLHVGSPSARVSQVNADWLPATRAFTTFQVRHSRLD